MRNVYVLNSDGFHQRYDSACLQYEKSINKIKIIGVRYLDLVPPSFLHILSLKGSDFIQIDLLNNSDETVNNVSIYAEIPDYSHPYFAFVDELQPFEQKSIHINPIFRRIDSISQFPRNAALNIRISRRIEKYELVEYEHTFKITFLGKNDMLWSECHPFDLADYLAVFLHLMYPP